LVFILCVGAGAIFIPWLMVRRFALIGLFAPLAAMACWLAYEIHLRSLARAGDPLIRVDLLLIVPMVALAWLSAIAAIAYKRSQGRSTS
jgi:hypothetical protein